MPRRCYISGCVNQSNNKLVEGIIVYHRIPKNEELRKKWLAVLKKDDTTPEPSSKERICSDHFLYEDFSFRATGQVRLKKGAVPSVNLDSTAACNPKNRICRAPNCNNDESNGVVLHDIPYGGKIRQKWLAAMKRPQWNPPRGTCICSDHFSENCFKKRDKNVLLQLAVPIFRDLHNVNGKNKSPVHDIDSPLECHLGEKLTIPGKSYRRRRKELDESLLEPLVEPDSLQKEQKKPRQEFNENLEFRSTSGLKPDVQKFILGRYSPDFEKLDKDPLAIEDPVKNPLDSGVKNEKDPVAIEAPVKNPVNSGVKNDKDPLATEAPVDSGVKNDKDPLATETPAKNPLDSGMSKSMLMQKIRTVEQSNRSLSQQIKTTQQRMRRRGVLMTELRKKKEQLSMGLLNQVMLVAEDALKDVLREYLKNPKNSVEETVRRSNKLCLHTEVSFLNEMPD